MTASDPASPAFGAADLSNCDREPIHVPGSIQPHGALLVLDLDELVILQVAGDTAGLLGHTPEALLGRRLADLFDPVHVETLRSMLAHGDLATPLHALDPDLRLHAVPIDASVHRTRMMDDEGSQSALGASVIVVEFEAADRSDARGRDPLSTVQHMLAVVNSAPGVHAFCQTATEQLRRVTGYDRVMVYRFLPGGEGWVFAESHAEGLEPYLELRYPASDIPKQARELYLRNWLRIIADVDYVPAPLLAQDAGPGSGTLDMSQCTLRAVSPIHLEYLRNMDAAATMTISVIRGGRLWGLIACHHRTPKRIPRHLRAVCELFGHMFSFQLDAREQAEGYEYRHKLRQVHEKLVRHMAVEGDLADGLTRQRPNLLDYVEADGVALLVEGKFSAIGRTPREDHVRALVDWLDRTHGDEGVFATASLSSHWALGRDFAIDASGVLALAASRSPRDYIFWFRPEVIETVRWAGDPNKPVEAGPQGDRIGPRSSFKAYVQSVRLHAKPWTEAEIEAVQLLRLSLLEVILKRIDQVARERGAAQARHDVMLAELNHRVKNTLATIQALARHSKRSAPTLDAYVHGFEQRIQAMSASHNLLTDAAWETVDLRTLIGEQLRPYAVEGDNLMMEGERVALQARTGTSLGMAVHELATNAAKYGALSVPGGRVRIRWHVTGNAPSRLLALSWREEGGPPVKPPTRQGFGSFVTQRFVAYETQGRSEVRYEPEGVTCEMEVPEAALMLNASNGISPNGSSALPGEAIDETRVLIVEDEALVAHVLEEAVLALGWTPIGPVARVETALVLVQAEAGRLRGAVLDINLANVKVWAVAEVLQDQDVPFLFATGYDRSPGMIPNRFADVPVLGKPFVEQQLMDALERVVAKGRVQHAEQKADGA